VARELLAVDEAGLVEGAQVGDQVAVGHVQLAFEILKRPWVHPRGEQRHDRQPAFFVDDLVEL